MNKGFLLAICAIVLLVASPVYAAYQRQEAGPIPLIVGIGQSNMAGTANSGSVTQTPVPGAVMMHWNDTNNVWFWMNMKEPASVWNNNAPKPYVPVPNLPKVGKYGPSTAFMRRVMANQGWANAGFLNCGWGGSPVSSWAPSSSLATDAPNFENCWERIEYAQDNGYKVVGVIVVNGETEAMSSVPSVVTGYPGAMNRMYDALAARLGQPHLPMAFVVLGEPPVPPVSWNTIRDYQLALRSSYPENNWQYASAWGILRASETPAVHYARPTDYDQLGIYLANRIGTPFAFVKSLTPTPTRTPTPTPIP